MTQAAICSKVDTLKGLKENVIMGRLIPAGTGSAHYQGLAAQEAREEDGDQEVDGEAVTATSEDSSTEDISLAANLHNDL